MAHDDDPNTIQMKDGRALFLKSRLGIGTHGIVYQASLTRRDRPGEMLVAVKMGRGTKTTAGETNLSREYQLLRGFAHPSIVTALECFDADGMMNSMTV